MSGHQRSSKRRPRVQSGILGRAEQLFTEACAAHRAGDLNTARQRYHKILAAQPRHADARHLLGFAEFQSSRFSDAIAHLTEAVRLRPDAAEFRNNLALAFLAAEQVEPAAQQAAAARDLGYQDGHGYLHVGWEFFQRRKYPLAEASYRLSLLLEPNSAEPYNYLGVLEAEQKRWNEAEANYRRALELRPHFVEALNNLGNALRDQDRVFEALPYYRQAIALDPQFASAHNNLGVALAREGQAAAAMECYQQALRCQPQFAEALNNLGNACLDLGRIVDAIAYYQQSLQLSPKSPEVLCNLGASLRQQGQVVEAIGVLRRAIMLRPDSERIHQQLVAALSAHGNTAAADDCCRQLARLDPQQPLWALRASAILPAVYSTRAEVSAAVGRLRDGIAETRQRRCELKLAEWTEIAPPCPFELQFLDGNLRTLKEAYAAVFRQRLAPGTYASWIESWQRPRIRARIGFVVTDGHEGVFLKSLGGVLERLSRQWELIVLCSGHGAARMRTEIARDDLQLVTLPSRFDRMAQTIAEARCDLLYYWEVGTDAANYFLPFLRLAPVQVTSWGVQVTSGIDTLDAYLSSDLIEPGNAQRYYTEPLKLARTLLTYRSRAKLPARVLPRDAFAAPARNHWYVCAQQLGKFHLDFDDLLAGILRQDPLGVVVIAGDKYGFHSNRLRERFAATIPDVTGRIHILPRLDQVSYLSLLHHADVLLDPPHFGGVNSSYDAFSLGKPLVVLPSADHRGRYALGCYRKIGFFDCLAASSRQYVDLAVRIGTDEEFQRSLAVRLTERSGALFEDLSAVTEHDRIFAELLRSTAAAECDAKS